MKIRNDFVTNSSSSSYIIAYRQIPEIDKETLKHYLFLRAYQRTIDGIISCESNDTRPATVIKTKKEFDEYFVERYGWSKAPTVKDILKDDEGLKEIYNKVVEYFDKGYAVFCKNIGYDDNGLIALVQAIAEGNEDFVILEDQYL